MRLLRHRTVSGPFLRVPALWSASSISGAMQQLGTAPIAPLARYFLSSLLVIQLLADA